MQGRRHDRALIAPPTQHEPKEGTHMQATTRTKRIAVAAAIASTLVTNVALNAVARDRTPANRYAATVKCNGMAEDSAAHVRLVRYDPNEDGTITLVYRCMRTGY